jgi:hypothetical protein
MMMKAGIHYKVQKLMIFLSDDKTAKPINHNIRNIKSPLQSLGYSGIDRSIKIMVQYSGSLLAFYRKQLIKPN